MSKCLVIKGYCRSIYQAKAVDIERELTTGLLISNTGKPCDTIVSEYKMPGADGHMESASIVDSLDGTGIVFGK